MSLTYTHTELRARVVTLGDIEASPTVTKDCHHLSPKPLGGLADWSTAVQKQAEEIPIGLHNLAARTIVPALSRSGVCREAEQGHDDSKHKFKSLPARRGFYAVRRGLATLATSVDTQLAAKSLLRHGNIHTTQAHYIKSVPSDALRAVATIDQLFHKSVGSAPN